MRSPGAPVLCLTATILMVAAIPLVAAPGAPERPAVAGREAAQQAPATSPSDPRVGLAAGFRDAGTAARNMELVLNLPKPAGFFDPEAPAGRPAAGPDRGGRGAGAPPQGQPAQGQAAPGQPEEPPPPQPQQLSFTNSDLAFSREYVFQGNYHGFHVYNVADASRAELFA